MQEADLNSRRSNVLLIDPPIDELHIEDIIKYVQFECTSEMFDWVSTSIIANYNLIFKDPKTWSGITFGASSKYKPTKS